MSQDSLLLFIFSRGIEIKIYYYFYYIDKNVKKMLGRSRDRSASNDKILIEIAILENIYIHGRKV